MEIKDDFSRAFFFLIFPLRRSVFFFLSPYSSLYLCPGFPLFSFLYIFFFTLDRPRTHSLHLPFDYKSIVYTTTLRGSVENSSDQNNFYFLVAHGNKEKLTLQFLFHLLDFSKGLHENMKRICFSLVVLTNKKKDCLRSLPFQKLHSPIRVKPSLVSAVHLAKFSYSLY